MKVLLTGASGFVGNKLGLALVHNGHEVVAVARDPGKTKLPFKAELRSWDKLGDLGGVDAIIHLAGETVAQRWSPEAKKKIISSRVDSAKKLREALERSPGARLSAFLCASAVGYYGDGGDKSLAENELPGKDFLAEVCVEWEKAAAAFRPFSGRVASFRIGLVLGRDGGALPKMLPAFKLGLGGRLGAGEQWMSWIHVSDLVALFLFALENSSIRGVYNAVAPQPAKNKDFTKALGEAIGRPTRIPVPGLALRALMGEMSGMLLGGQRASALKIEEAGFRFRYPALSEALRSLHL